jgi:hypothetical protein
MNIAGLSKPAVLAALFNASRQQGMGFTDMRGTQPMTEADAAEVIKTDGMYFDYLRGRVMKISLDGDELETRLYDRDNGQGAAERAIEPLRATAPA